MIAANPLPEHALRRRLNDELHSRPPVVLDGPTWITHLVMLHELAGGRIDHLREEAHLRGLCELAQTPFCPLVTGNHWILEAGDLRLKWERHGEFSSYTFFRRHQPGDAAYATALEAFPSDWLCAIPGTLLVATHLDYLDAGDGESALLAELARSDVPQTVTEVADGAALVISDFRLHDGFTRFRVLDRKLRRRQSGRTVQRVLEIETYRMMALLAFPVAREVSALLARAEQDTAALMTEMAQDRGHESERHILAGLTRLAAEIELSITRTNYRFGGAEAYYALVMQRVAGLRGRQVDDFSSMQGFLERRLTPAIQTCLATARRQADLSARIARKSALLRTRVDIELEQQNQQLLTQLNRRSQLQLRLQETVEGLSVVAITYYASALVHHLAEGAHHLFHGPDPALVAAASIPLIALIVALGVRRMRRRLTADHGPEHSVH